MSREFAGGLRFLVSLTKQLTSHVNKGHHEDALSLFRHMHSVLGLSLDSFVFPLVLKSCSALRRPLLAASVHALAAKSSFLSNSFIASALIHVYGSCVSLHRARQLFDEIPMRNAVVWNAMISLYAHGGHLPHALALFKSMDAMPNDSCFNAIISGLAATDNGSYKAIAFYRRMRELGLRPNLITFLALLPACASVGGLSLIKEIHGYSFRSGVGSHPQLDSSLVEAYGRCGFLAYACQVFGSMEKKDVVAWSSMISAYALHGDASMALHIFQQMEFTRVAPDELVLLAVLKACSHAGLADKAQHYFERICNNYSVNVTSDHYSCLVDVLGRAGRLEEAYRVVKEMPVKPTAKTWGALLGACRNYGEVELAEIAGRALFELEPHNPANYVLLGKLYVSVGRQEEAERIRREMKERGVKVAPGSSWFTHQD